MPAAALLWPAADKAADNLWRSPSANRILVYRETGRSCPSSRRAQFILKSLEAEIADPYIEDCCYLYTGCHLPISVFLLWLHQSLLQQRIEPLEQVAIVARPYLAGNDLLRDFRRNLSAY